MINEQILLDIFQNAVDIIPDTEDSVFLGTLEITAAPAGVDAIMEYWTQMIDAILVEPNIGDTQKLELITMRGFTFNEYPNLFDIGIKEADYYRYPVYQSLLISSLRERAGLIYQLRRDSYEDYLKLLSRTLRTFNVFLYTFLYETFT